MQKNFLNNRTFFVRYIFCHKYKKPLTFLKVVTLCWKYKNRITIAFLKVCVRTFQDLLKAVFMIYTCFTEQGIPVWKNYNIRSLICNKGGGYRICNPFLCRDAMEVPFSCCAHIYSGYRLCTSVCSLFLCPLLLLQAERTCYEN